MPYLSSALSNRTGRISLYASQDASPTVQALGGKPHTTMTQGCYRGIIDTPNSFPESQFILVDDSDEQDSRDGKAPTDRSSRSSSEMFAALRSERNSSLSRILSVS